MCTLTLIAVQVEVDFWKIEGIIEHNWYCKVMIEAANHLTLHPTSILYIYIVFQELYTLWMGIWVHPYANICAGGGRFLEN